ncbi:MAG: YraN family protein [Terriglobia bacterium]
MGLYARAMFGLVNALAARGGLQPKASEDEAEEGRERRRTGVRGETFAYWYLRRRGYTVVARNHRVPHLHGEIDLIGWEGDVLAFVEVKTRTTSSGGPPEDQVDANQQRVLQAMARDYLARRGLERTRYRFDLLALEARPGARPRVRLHKAAFGAG